MTEPTMSALVGENVRLLRRTDKLTQAEVASRCGWGQNKQSRIERGRKRVSVDDLEVLALALGTSPAWLLGPYGSMEPTTTQTTGLNGPFTRRSEMQTAYPVHPMFTEMTVENTAQEFDAKKAHERAAQHLEYAKEAAGIMTWSPGQIKGRSLPHGVVSAPSIEEFRRGWVAQHDEELEAAEFWLNVVSFIHAQMVSSLSVRA